MVRAADREDRSGIGDCASAKAGAFVLVCDRRLIEKRTMI